jgi:hypothetical protein
VPTPLFSDSTGAIIIARHPVKHELTKHIGVDASYTRAQVQDNIIALRYVSSELSLADFHQGTDTSSASVLSLQTQFSRSTLSLKGGVRDMCVCLYIPTCIGVHLHIVHVHIGASPFLSIQAFTFLTVNSDFATTLCTKLKRERTETMDMLRE